jgi:hypothetical protein
MRDASFPTRASRASAGVKGMIETTLSLDIPSAKLYAIASEVATIEFRMLPSTRFAPSNRVRMSSMKVIWCREQSQESGAL